MKSVIRIISALMILMFISWGLSLFQAGRHRHAGGIVHSHSESERSHSGLRHAHTHSEGVSHSHDSNPFQRRKIAKEQELQARGDHWHLSFFGIEFTVWDFHSAYFLRDFENSEPATLEFHRNSLELSLLDPYAKSYVTLPSVWQTGQSVVWFFDLLASEFFNFGHQHAGDAILAQKSFYSLSADAPPAPPPRILLVDLPV